MNDLDRCLSLEYPVKIQWLDGEKLFVAEFFDLPGCQAYGKTVEEAYKNAQEAKKDWMQVSLEQGLTIPKPSVPAEHSGRILVRIPSSLHTMLVDRAKQDGTSLNQFIVHLLSGAVVGEGLSAQVTSLAEEIYRLRERILALTSRVNRLVSQSQVFAQPISTSSHLFDLSEPSIVSTNVESAELVNQVSAVRHSVPGRYLILTEKNLGGIK